jgi:hypothetical protein
MKKSHLLRDERAQEDSRAEVGWIVLSLKESRLGAD